MNLLVITTLFSLLYIPSEDITKKLFCSTHGDIAFVQNRNDADIRIRFVASGEDARIALRQQANDPGEWRVVSRYADPDLKVYIETTSGNDIIDIKIVDNAQSCR